jgi:hypothetical protein
VFGARADKNLADAPAQQIDDLAALVADGSVRFDLTWGEAGTSEVRTFGSVALERPYKDDISFNPFNSHPGVRPVGGLNRLRLETYMSSQAARLDSPSRG